MIVQNKLHSEKDFILMMIGILDHDLNRMYQEVEHLAEEQAPSLDRFHADIVQFRQNFSSVGESILEVFKTPGLDRRELFHMKGTIINDLERIKAKLERLGGMLITLSHLYN